MEITSYLILGILIVVSPGADFVLVFKNSLAYGRKVGVLTGLGIGAGVSIHITYSILGISHLLSQNPVLFTLIKYTGASYLIYLGITGILSSKLAIEPEPEKLSSKLSHGRKYFVQGFLCNVLNPKTMLFFLSIFSQLVPVDDSSSHQFALFYGVYMSAMHMIWFCLVAWLVTSKKVLGVFHRAGHRVNQVCGVGLIAFGASLVLAK